MRKVSRKKRKEQKKGIYQPSLFERRRGGQPGNSNAVKHGLYSKRFSPEEIENLSEMRDGLTDEIEIARVALSRIWDYMQTVRLEEMEIEDYVALQNLIAKYTSTISRLKQVDKALTDAQNVGLGAQLLAALEDVNASLMEK